MLKDTNEQPIEEIHRVRCGSITIVASIPMEWCASQSQHVDAFTHLEALQAPYLRILWRLPRGGIILTPLQPLSSLQRIEDGAEIFKLLIMAFALWSLAPTQEPTKRHLIRTEDIPFTQVIPRNLEVLCQRWSQRLNIRMKDALSAPVT